MVDAPGATAGRPNTGLGEPLALGDTAAFEVGDDAAVPRAGKRPKVPRGGAVTPAAGAGMGTNAGAGAATAGAAASTGAGAS